MACPTFHSEQEVPVSIPKTYLIVTLAVRFTLQDSAIDHYGCDVHMEPNWQTD